MGIKNALLLLSQNKRLKKIQKATVDMYQTIQDYEGMTVAIQSGNYDELN